MNCTTSAITMTGKEHQVGSGASSLSNFSRFPNLPPTASIPSPHHHPHLELRASFDSPTTSELSASLEPSIPKSPSNFPPSSSPSPCDTPTSSSSTPSSGVDRHLWHACAGSLTHIPAKGSHLAFFPQGYGESCSGERPRFKLNQRSTIICVAEEVKLLADEETDEVYVRLTLSPESNQEEAMDASRWLDSSLLATSGHVEDSPIGRLLCFAKTLTQSDANNGGGFSVPRYCAETIFPPLNYATEPPLQTLLAKDVHGKLWKFRHIYRGTPKRHLLTTGWSTFVNAKKLTAGDTVIFLRNDNNQLCVGVRRASLPRARTPGKLSRSNGGESPGSFQESSSIMEGVASQSKINIKKMNLVPLKRKTIVTSEEVLLASDLAHEGKTFDVVLFPRNGSADFCVDAQKYFKSLSYKYLPGRKCQMAYETEDLAHPAWLHGVIRSTSPMDPVSFPESSWRLLNVLWEESEKKFNEKVSPWQVELVDEESNTISNHDHIDMVMHNTIANYANFGSKIPQNSSITFVNGAEDNGNSPISSAKRQKSDSPKSASSSRLQNLSPSPKFEPFSPNSSLCSRNLPLNTDCSSSFSTSTLHAMLASTAFAAISESLSRSSDTLASPNLDQNQVQIKQTMPFQIAMSASNDTSTLLESSIFNTHQSFHSQQSPNCPSRISSTSKSPVISPNSDMSSVSAFCASSPHESQPSSSFLTSMTAFMLEENSITLGLNYHSNQNREAKKSGKKDKPFVDVAHSSSECAKPLAQSSETQSSHSMMLFGHVIESNPRQNFIKNLHVAIPGDDTWQAPESSPNHISHSTPSTTNLDSYRSTLNQFGPYSSSSKTLESSTSNAIENLSEGGFNFETRSPKRLKTEREKYDGSSSRVDQRDSESGKSHVSHVGHRGVHVGGLGCGTTETSSKNWVCKIFLENESVGRSVDLSNCKNISELAHYLGSVFKIDPIDLINRLVFHDSNSGWLLATSIPFEKLMLTAKKAMILMFPISPKKLTLK